MSENSAEPSGSEKEEERRSRYCMKTRSILGVVSVLLFILGTLSTGFSAHEEKGTVKGTITKVETSEVEITVKDEKGKEMKIKTKDGTFKVGDRIVIRDGKVSKEVKPITGGY